MPPSLPASSLGSMARCHPSRLTVRAFSSTSHCAYIGPESPKYIEIPRPPQRFAKTRVDVKGHLPTPRNLFRARDGDKTSPEYLASVTREPSAAHQQAAAPNEYIAWKRRMAASRRENLREGLVALQERKAKADQKVAALSAAKQRDRNRRVNAPERDSDRLTNPTVTAAMATFQHGPLPDPDREARVKESAERTAARAAAIEAERRDALHTLYMNARSFITTEKQLDAEIERLFTEQPFAHIQGKERATSIWDAEGPPPRIQDMLSEVSNTQMNALDFYQSPAKIAGKRMVRVAEELTGGKMD